MGREQQSVGGRLGNHNAPRCRTDDRAKCVRLLRSNASITMFFNLYNTIQYNQDLSLATLVSIIGNPHCLLP